MTTEETLELIHIQWITDRSVKVRIRQSVMTFSTWNTKKIKPKTLQPFQSIMGRNLWITLSTASSVWSKQYHNPNDAQARNAKENNKRPSPQPSIEGGSSHKFRISTVNRLIPHVHHWMVLFKKLLVVLNSTTPSCSAPSQPQQNLNTQHMNTSELDF